MLTEACYLFEGFRGGGINILHTVCPDLRLQGVDGVLTRHEIDITATQLPAQLLILTFRVQADNAFPGLTEVHQQELEQIALALTGITENDISDRDSYRDFFFSFFRITSVRLK